MSDEAVRDAGFDWDMPRSRVRFAKTLAAITILLQQICRDFIFLGLNVESLESTRMSHGYNSVLLKISLT